MFKCSIVLVALVLSIVGTGLSGCVGVNRAQLRTMPADAAWQKIDDEARNANVVGAFVGGGLAKAYASMQEEERARMRAAAQQASTPEAALREMVEDVSGYLLTSLPAHARDRGVDQYRLNLGMGELVNRDHDPTLRSALTLIRNELVNNRRFTDQFRILYSDQSRREEIIRELADRYPELHDPDGSGSDGGYDPRSLYVVEGQTWVHRDDARYELTVHTSVELWHPDSREMVGNDIFTRRYYFHPAESRYITEADNESRRQSSGRQASAL